MTETPECDRCRRLVHDQSYVCDRCGSELARELALVAKLAGEVTVTVARLSRTGQPGRRVDPNSPLPVSLAAANDHGAAVSVLLTWARHVSYERGERLPTVRLAPCVHPSCALRRVGRMVGPICAGEPAEQPLAVLAGWLAEVGRLRWLRHRPEAGEAFDELLDACRLFVRVVDRPAERWYAGRCDVDGCQAELYPVAGVTTVTCRDCGSKHDLDERKRDLLVQAEDVLSGASWCAATLTRLGLPAKVNTVVTWAKRGRLIAKSADAAGRPLYRFGDVRDLVIDAQHREKLRTLRAAERAAELADAQNRTDSLTDDLPAVTLVTEWNQSVEQPA